MRANRYHKKYNVGGTKGNVMEVTIAYKFRIYPDAKRQAEIDERLVLAQQFYNKILETRSLSFRIEKEPLSCGYVIDLYLSLERNLGNPAFLFPSLILLKKF